MNKRILFQENLNTILRLISEGYSIAATAQEICKKVSIPYSDKYRRALSRFLKSLKKQDNVQFPKPGVYSSEFAEHTNESSITGGKLRSAWGKPGSMQYSYRFDEQDEYREQFRKELIEDIKTYAPKVSFPKDFHFPKGDCLLEICMPDFHIGRERFTSVENDLFSTVFWSLCNRASDIYDIDRIEFPIGNDFLNSDNADYTTTRGTKQFDYSKWYESFRQAWQLLVQNIYSASRLYPVNVRTILGNHDKTRMFYIGELVKAYFTNIEGVTVENEVGKFHMFEWGNNLVMYDHGEVKAMDYPLIMATEYPEAFARTKYREVHTGHLHKEMVNEYRGIKVRYLPSLAKESDWEKEQFKHVKQAQALVWHKKHGLIDILQYNVH